MRTGLVAWLTSMRRSRPAVLLDGSGAGSCREGAEPGREESSTTVDAPSYPAGRVRRSRTRVCCTAVGRGLGIAGLAGYNWWIVVAWNRRLLQSPDELFSDLEAVGRPYARLLSDVDVASGVAILAAILLVGLPGPAGRRREWWLLVAFACAGVLGGLFPYQCPEGLSAACRSAEWSFALSWRHYMHVIAGIVEFGSASTAALLAWRRARGRPGIRPLVHRGVVAVLAVGYPLLAVTYLTGRFGAFVEPVFFLAFSAVVAAELAEARS